MAYVDLFQYCPNHDIFFYVEAGAVVQPHDLPNLSGVSRPYCHSKSPATDRDTVYR